LHAAHLAADGAGESARERRLADARHVLEEHVTSREQCDEGKLDHVRLAFESAPDGSPELEKLLGASGLESER
jgi:hypothetical protein